MRISVPIITFNEEENIYAACKSVMWADEIIVVDSESTDRTREIAASCGARVITRPWPGFAAQKQFAMEQARNEWVLSLDADERVSDELRDSILKLKDLEDARRADGYLIARRSWYMNRWIKGGGWYPDRQLRLFRKSKASWGNAIIHESVSLERGAKVKTLKGDILHYSVRDAAHHNLMIGTRYAPLAAEQMYNRGKRSSVLKIATAGVVAFTRSYILKGGWRDGLAGYAIAHFAAHHAFLKHLLLWEKQNNEKCGNEYRCAEQPE